MLINVEWDGQNRQWVNPEIVDRNYVQSITMTITMSCRVYMQTGTELLTYNCDSEEAAHDLMSRLAQLVNTACIQNRLRGRRGD